MLPASPTLIDLSPASARPDVEGREIWRLIAFSRGLMVGFLSAFFIFDWALLEGETMLGVLRGLQHVGSAVLYL
jgi:hypothetical protein